MAGLFIKLDHDWLRDPKVRTFKKEAGKAALVDLIQLYILMSRNRGSVDMNDYGQREDASDVLGMSEQRMTRFLDLAADCGVIDKAMWLEAHIVTSNRAVKDAMKKEARSEAGRAGGEASGRARAAKQNVEANASQASA